MNPSIDVETNDMGPHKLCFYVDGDRRELERLGFSLEAIDEIFLRSSKPRSDINLVSGAPDGVVSYARREYLASSFVFDAIRLKEIRTRDIWSNTELSCRTGWALAERGRLAFEMLPLFYRFSGLGGREFWLACYSPYGKVTHIVVPRDDGEGVVIYDHDAHSVAATIYECAADLSRQALSDDSRGQGARRPVAIMAMLENHAHQLMNQLSGAQRLLEEGVDGAIEEFWVSGVEFFGKLEALFPEFRGRIRRFDSHWDMHGAINTGDYLPVAIGSNLFKSTLRRRLKWPNSGTTLRSAIRRRSRPLVAVTMRVDGRVCRNLPEVLAEVLPRLKAQHPEMGIIIDGWVMPDEDRRRKGSSPDDLAFYDTEIRKALNEAKRLVDLLPAGLVVENVIGWTMSRSLSALSRIDAYLAHVGTPQHKLSFVTGTRGVVHGPAATLNQHDSGHFMSDSGFAPVFLETQSVRDIPTETWRGPTFSDYEIIDMDAVVDEVDRVLSQAL